VEQTARDAAVTPQSHGNCERDQFSDFGTEVLRWLVGESVSFLASDKSRDIKGIELFADGGTTQPVQSVSPLACRLWIFSHWPFFQCKSSPHATVPSVGRVRDLLEFKGVIEIRSGETCNADRHMRRRRNPDTKYGVLCLPEVGGKNGTRFAIRFSGQIMR
jgi:hypothetical protein